MTSFSAAVWQQNLPLYEKTLNHPFNRDLAAGTLTPERFKHYMIQDAHYLEGFARGLSLVAAKAWSTDHIVQFADAAKEAIVVERALHADYFRQFAISAEDFASAERSPTCAHYVATLLSVTALEPFEVGLAALLPCFWIYREVGAALYKQTGGNALASHPYKAWIETYAGAEFDASVDAVIATVDSVAAATAPRTTRAMQQAYTRSAQLEWMFWESAYQLEGWPA
ncbi:MAG: thiaminase II [Pseudomonadota bacterium]